MKTLPIWHSSDLCMALLHAESEDAVINVLKEYDLWSDRALWRPYGDISNNRAVVGNQQGSPVAALVEKLVNSIDAVLTAECMRKGIDPTSHEAPSSMQAAVGKFLSIPDGLVQNLDSRSRTYIAQRINLIACGSKTNPCYLIIDEGEGQNPDQFPETFLSLLRENKTKIKFVQGKYNMGGTGVLQFSGSNSFQLIISRRQQYLSDASPKWGFTIIRRLEPGPNQPQSTYVYLAPNNQILSFEATFLPVKPGKFPYLYCEPLEAGTCIKIWNYKLPGRLKTIATLDLRYALEQHLQAPAIPIRISERRQYSAHYYDTTMSGLYSVLADNPDNIEPGFDTGSPIEVPAVGPINLRIVVLRQGVDEKQYKSGIFFNVNGQLHSELGRDFIIRRAKLDYIASSMIVTVDCTNLPVRIREDLFLASRDRMRQCDERDSLEEAIIEFIKNHPGLKELNALRRQAILESGTEEETTKIIQNLLRSDPTLAMLFGRGMKINVPVGPLPEPVPFEGRQFPTFFRIYREPQGGFFKGCPRNRACQVVFETDAANDYFSRSTDPGRLESTGLALLTSYPLYNGKAYLHYSLPGNCQVGDHLHLTVSVSDISRIDSFEAAFTIRVEADAMPSEDISRRQNRSQIIGFPEPKEVYQDQWGLHGFNEKSAVELKHADDDSLDMFINMDNLYLRNEIARRRNMDPGVIRHRFKYGLYLLALGMLYQQRQAHQNEEESNGKSEETEDLKEIEEACKGMAVTLIPVITLLSEKIVNTQNN